MMANDKGIQTFWCCGRSSFNPEQRFRLGSFKAKETAKLLIVTEALGSPGLYAGCRLVKNEDGSIQSREYIGSIARTPVEALDHFRNCLERKLRRKQQELEWAAAELRDFDDSFLRGDFDVATFE